MVLLTARNRWRLDSTHSLSSTENARLHASYALPAPQPVPIPVINMRPPLPRASNRPETAPATAPTPTLMKNLSMHLSHFAEILYSDATGGEAPSGAVAGVVLEDPSLALMLCGFDEAREPISRSAAAEALLSADRGASSISRSISATGVEKSAHA